MKKTVLSGFCATLALLAFDGPRPAYAQGDQPAAGGNLEEIVVTARRREERIQTVPIAITAFSGTELAQKSIQNFYNLQNDVPSYSFVANQRSGIGGVAHLRGLPGVVEYFAEVPIPEGHLAGDALTFDLDNMQVLHGPQGTLFGQNATGGAILFEPKRPTNEFEGSLEATLGSYNWHQVKAILNAPIVDDKLMVRLGFLRDERDGFTTVQNGPYAGKFGGLDLDNNDEWYARASVIFRPTDDIENYLVADSTYVHTNGTANILHALNPTLTGPGSPAAAAGFAINFLANQAPYRIINPLTALALQQALGPRQILGFNPTLFSPNGAPLTQQFPGPLEKAQNFTIVDQTRIDLTDDTTLKNIVGYFDARQLTREDFSGVPFLIEGFNTPRGYNDSNAENAGGAGTSTQYSEELQLQSSALDGRLKYQIGGFVKYLSQGPASGQVYLGQQGVGEILAEAGGGTQARSQALYAQGTYDFGGLFPFLDGLKFTGGFRYNWDYTSNYAHTILQTFFIPNIGALPGLLVAPGAFCANVAPSAPPACEHAAAGHFHSPGWNLSLDYQIDPETLIYVRSSKGYRAGGFLGSAPAGYQSFGPEYLVDVEVGAKVDYEVLGMKARTNVAAYHGWYSDVQVPVTVFINLAGQPSPYVATQNAASAIEEGVEGEFELRPFEGLDLHANLSFNHDYYTNFTFAGAGNLGSIAFAQFPKLKFDFSPTYHFPIDPAYGDVAFSLDWTYQTHYNFKTDPEPSVVPTHRNLNLRVDWTDIFQEPVDLSFFMTNVTNATYPVGDDAYYTTIGYAAYVYNEPRMWGFTMRYRFTAPNEPEATPAAFTPPPAQAPAPAPHSYLVFFDFDKSDLTPQATQIVDEAAKNAGPAHVTRITCTGHTDTVGSAAYNMRLSKRRAESVASELEKDGVRSSEIEIVAKGKTDPLVATGDGVKEPQNRRVQIVYEGGPTS